MRSLFGSCLCYPGQVLPMCADLMVFSAGEAWSTVPVLEVCWPAWSLCFQAAIWPLSAATAVAAACWNHGVNHQHAACASSACGGLRLSVASFWATQVLERVAVHWREAGRRSHWPHGLPSNRLSAAWIGQGPDQRKATWVWVVVLFTLLVVGNVFGLVPLCGAVTGQAGFTLGLSVAFWCAVAYAGVGRLGSRFVKLFLPSGPKWPMAPVFVLLESVSYGFRAISLGVRLWANMLAGHQLIHLVTALALVPVLCLSPLLAVPISVCTCGLLLALSGLEAAVCVLQAGVFCLLASFYLQEALTSREALAVSRFVGQRSWCCLTSYRALCPEAAWKP